MTPGNFSEEAKQVVLYAHKKYSVLNLNLRLYLFDELPDMKDLQYFERVHEKARAQCTPLLKGALYLKILQEQT